MKNKKITVRELTTLAMITAIAYVLVATIRIPVVLFLKYEPKDVIITIGGFLMGPMAALASSVVVALIEMVTISETGIIGCIMNFLSTCTYACTAAIIYRRNHTQKGAVLALAVGTVTMTATMLLWNYLITPLYMNVPRSVVLEQILPVFLPFNAIKCVLNAALTMLLYKSVSSALRATKLLPPSETRTSPKKYLPVIVLSALIVIGITLGLLAWKGMI